ncbi:MAG: ATP-binding cassette domain-containing protein [Desulfohalobiaceae bacterium]|nr:ATP-binding cassette domain-containing protein [Desulfohalobiaceae bacterium]
MTNTEQALELKNIHKRFGPLEVLKGVSFSAKEGEIISMLGSSGSGKSTLLRCINLLEVPDEGQVIVSGELIRMKTKGTQRKPADNKQVNRIRSGLGMVFQDFNLWANMTARQNVTEAPIHVLKLPKAEARERADALLEKVGIYDKSNYYPSQLSGGQQQRVAIARALAMEPRVLLFDEPTSALDPELVGEVLRVIRTLAEERRTMLIVTHEISFAREISNRIVFLDNGQIELEGTPQEVIDNPQSERCRKFLSLES